MRYIELIIVNTKIRDDVTKVQDIKLRKDNPPSYEEMEKFFDEQSLEQKETDKVKKWLDCYNYYFEYKQHKDLNFIEELNMLDKAWRRLGFYKNCTENP